MSNKIGDTDGAVFFTHIQQYLMSPVLGGKVVMSDPHPDARGTSAITLSVVPAADGADVSPDVEAVLRALSRTTSAVGRGQSVFVENLPVNEDEEVKYTITIKKK